MLRKSAREFLETEFLRRAYGPDNPNTAKLKKYPNPSQGFQRVVKQANKGFEDIAYILDKIDPKYRRKIDVRKGLQKIMFHRKDIIDNNNRILILQEALTDIETSLDTIKRIVGKKDNNFYNLAIYPRLKELQTLISFVAEHPEHALAKVAE